MKSKAIFSASILLICVGSSCSSLRSQPIPSPTIAAAAESSTVSPTLPLPSPTSPPPTLPPAPTLLPTLNSENLDQLVQLHAYSSAVAEVFGQSVWETSDISPVAYSPDGRYVALSGCTEYFNGGDSGRLYCGFSGDPSDDESAKSFVLIIDAATEELIASLPDNEPDTTVTDLAFAHDGSKLFFTLYHPDRAELAVWDTASQQIESELWEGLGYPGIDLSPDNQWLALDNDLADESTGKVEIFDLTNGSVITELPGGYWAPQFSTDGRKLAVAPHDEVSIYDTGTWMMTGSIDLPCERCFTALSPDLSLLATADADQPNAPVLIWDIATGQQLQSLSAGDNDHWYIYFTPDGSMLWDFMYLQLAVWDTANWQLVQRQDPLGPLLPIEQAIGATRSIQFAADNRTFLLQTEWDVYLVGLPQ